ncbi:chaplin [Streptomyces sp. NPDC001939]|uniref:chaplin n=1 Tax=Streptomyces TaxID=1883 RepID=UPI001D09A12A|nr:chaplin [Streptomyces longhuiensis]UDM01184.1 chaplin [Streptomyces longhuiensis]
MSRIAKAAAVALGTGAVVISGAGLAMADAGAQGDAVRSPGVVSGDAVQAPVHVPVNLCGDTVDVIALLNPAFGNACANVGDDNVGDGGDDGGYGGGYGG